MNFSKLSVIGFTFISFLAIVFQLALALGVPWGEYAMGGTYPGQFPPEMRIAAVVQALIIALMISIVLARSGFAVNRIYDFSKKAIWFVVIYCAIGLFLNMITPSEKERLIWAPILLLNFIFSLRVALIPDRITQT